MNDSSSCCHPLSDQSQNWVKPENSERILMFLCVCVCVFCIVFTWTSPAWIVPLWPLGSLWMIPPCSMYVTLSKPAHSWLLITLETFQNRETLCICVICVRRYRWRWYWPLWGWSGNPAESETDQETEQIIF